MASILTDSRFAARKGRYLAQVGLGTAVLATVLVFEDALGNAAIVTAIASTVFLVFINPGATMAQPRRIIGGHSVALLVAFAFSAVLHDSVMGNVLGAPALTDVFAALAVGVAMLMMAITNTEHAPAAGTVLGLVVDPWSLNTAAAVVGAALALAVVRVVLKRTLIDLM